MMTMILFSATFYPTGVLGRANDAGGHSYTIYSYLQFIESCARESSMAEPARGLEEIGIFFTKYKEKRRNYPLVKAYERTISSGSTSSSTSALAAGEEKRGETGWMGMGSRVSGSRIPRY
jgi:hypothetical protein